MSFSRSGSTITQTGTDLSGLDGLLVVNSQQLGII
jgi:hypothetical protein